MQGRVANLASLSGACNSHRRTESTAVALAPADRAASTAGPFDVSAARCSGNLLMLASSATAPGCNYHERQREVRGWLACPRIRHRALSTSSCMRMSDDQSRLQRESVAQHSSAGAHSTFLSEITSGSTSTRARAARSPVRLPSSLAPVGYACSKRETNEISTSDVLSGNAWASAMTPSSPILLLLRLWHHSVSTLGMVRANKSFSSVEL